TRGGGVLSYGASILGSLRPPAVGTTGIVATPDGAGYWLYTTAGHVRGFGSARFFGARDHQKVGIAALTPLPDGRGYWLVSRTGRVFAFGRAQSYGGLNAQRPNASIVAIDATPSGLGYQLFASDGTVYAFGDAAAMSSSDLAADVVDGVSRDLGGSWEVTASGRVIAVGDAPFLGGLADKDVASPVVGIEATADGGGYWLVNAVGRVWAFGDANNAGDPGSHAPAVERAPVGTRPASVND
ncbi:MAG: hypothetical protein M3290_05750, partial [Actinomycetota bacterium]|nr:hypothetical protein [Actinomycetota bacterium]